MVLKNGFDIKHILIPVDFSPTSQLAIRHASSLAGIYKSEITLVHVLETIAYKTELPELSLDTFTQSDVSKAIENKLDQFAEEIADETGQVVNSYICSGKTSEKIVEACRESQCDLIVMGTHGVKGIREFFIGSNSYRVVTASPVPVITVQTDINKHGYRNVLLPVDLSMHSLEKVPVSASIAKHMAGQVHIFGLLTSDERYDQPRLEEKIHRIENFFRERGIAYSFEIAVANNFAVATMDKAAANNSDLIVIMTEQDEDFTGIFLGPFAQQIVNHSKIPVLSVRPHYGHLSYPEVTGGFRAP